ncbi:MAG TPA: alcohol dehydrogenase catalytic domain-containing protein [Acidimicrobiia bacterium]|nr:alcohol dehydrogenase catalytic domain-containing protein [Acidimicrobiia bacterium]
MPPDSMPAAVYTGDGRIEVRDLPVPEPGPRDVLVEVSHCGICGTDLHLVLGRIARPGSVLGHEWAGTVVAAGAEAGPWRPGERVVADATPGCGECRACRRGRPSVCLRREPPDYLSFRGAFSRYVTVAGERLLRVPTSLTTRAAALTEPTAVAMHAVTLSGATPDDRVLVTGAGPVGLLTLAVLRARGVEAVTVSEPAPRRRARAREIGAARVVEPAELDRPAVGVPVADPYTIAFECSGRAAAAEVALDQLDYAGTLVFVGTGHELPRVNHNRMIVLELTAVGAYNYDAGGFAPALELLDSGALPVELLVEPDDVTLDGLLETMHRLAAGELPGKVMVRPSA